MASQLDPRVCMSLKNGSLFEDSNAFSAEQMRPFLPCLITSAFTTTAQRSSVELDRLRCRLMDFPQCNSFAQILSTSREELENESNEMTEKEKSLMPKWNFESASPQQKVKIVANLLHKMSTSAAGSWFPEMELFDKVHLLEEVVCAAVACALLLPSRFDPSLIVRQLLSIANAPNIISLIVCNIPGCIEPTVESLLLMTFTEEESIAEKNRDSLLLKLLSMDSALVESCLNRLLSSDDNNGLALLVMCVCLSNEQLISRLLSALLCRHSITTFIQKSFTKSSVQLLHDRIAEAISFLSSSAGNPSEEACLAQLLAALRLMAGIRLDKEESRNWILYLTRTECDDDDYISTAVAAIIACPQLLPTNLGEDKEIEASLIAFFDWLKGRASQGCSSLQQFFLLLCIHFQASRGEQIASLVSDILGFKVTVNMRSLTALRNLFLRHAVTERDIAEQASRMHIIESFSVTYRGFLPAHCITQLLSTRVFSKHSIPIQNWISSQILKCVAPIHPAMVDLITSYARSCFPGDESETTSSPIPEKFFRELFSGEIIDEMKVAPRLLSLFFLLSYRDFWENLRSRNLICPYGPELESMLPVRYLIHVFESRPSDYEALRSPLIRLCGIYYPYMLPTVESSLIVSHEEIAKPRTGDLARELTLTDENFCNILDSVHINFSTVMRLLRRVERSPLRVQVRLRKAVVHALAVSLDPSIPAPIVASAVGIWKRIANVIPRTLYQATIRAWTDEELSHDLVTNQPHMLFRCKDGVFENAGLFSCFLDILSFYSSASRTLRKLQQRAATLSGPNKEEQRLENEELTNSLIAAQDSAIVQILLEVCQRFSNPAVSRLACGYVHQMFIADTKLCRIVHFQGYPVYLIPIAVRGIPSMHVCLDFVHELLMVNDISKRIFAIILVAELAQEYKIEKSFIRVDLILNVLSTLARTVPCDEYLRLMTSVVPSLGKMMSIFPQISGDIANLLSRVSVVAASRLSISATVLRSNSCPERKLIDLIDGILAEELTKITVFSPH